VHLDQKVPFVLACFQVSAAPPLEKPDSDEKDALFGLDTQITISFLHRQDWLSILKNKNKTNFRRNDITVLIKNFHNT
jgi:hypothetical protein